MLTCFALESCRRGIGLLTDAEFGARVKQADAIVQAVYDYKTRTGSWPTDTSFSELARVPKPDFHWKYHYFADGRPPMVTISPVMHCAGIYRFPDHNAAMSEFSNRWDFGHGGDAIRAWPDWESSAIPPP